ncbi:MAG: HAD family phosphatase [Rikenellaceae bacterium]
MAYKNIVFDLGGVVVARDSRKCTPEFLEFFSYVQHDPMPQFWCDYDRGTMSFEDVKSALAEYRGVGIELCCEWVDRTITMQEEVLPTKQLIERLKERGFKLYVLSNMAHEYIEFIRTLEVYTNFDGDIISSEEGVVKPEADIYKLLLDRFGLNPAETLFIDDRKINITAAEELGIGGFHFDANNPAKSCSTLEDMLLS